MGLIMPDKELIRKLHIDLCDASINKDLDKLNEILSDDYILVHMTGMRQTKEDYINSVRDGELKYYESIHEDIDISIDGDKAKVVGKTKTLASPFGFGKSWWNLRQDIILKKENGIWIASEGDRRGIRSGGRQSDSQQSRQRRRRYLGIDCRDHSRACDVDFQSRKPLFEHPRHLWNIGV